MYNITEYEYYINEQLAYSGKDVTKMPIIGIATTKAIGPFEEGTYNIVEIIDDGHGKSIYVADFWYKDYRKIPQLIHSDLVKSYEPVKDI